MKMQSNLDYKRERNLEIAEKLRAAKEADEERLHSLEAKNSEKKRRVEEKKKQEEDALKLTKDI